MRRREGSRESYIAAAMKEKEEKAVARAACDQIFVILIFKRNCFSLIFFFANNKADVAFEIIIWKVKIGFGEFRDGVHASPRLN